MTTFGNKLPAKSQLRLVLMPILIEKLPEPYCHICL